MGYTIRIRRQASRELERLDEDLVQRLTEKIDDLGENPWPNGCAKLRGRDNYWRIRVGDYRVIYEVDQKEKLVIIVGIKHRREAYD